MHALPGENRAGEGDVDDRLRRSLHPLIGQRQAAALGGFFQTSPETGAGGIADGEGFLGVDLTQPQSLHERAVEAKGLLQGQAHSNCQRRIPRRGILAFSRARGRRTGFFLSGPSHAPASFTARPAAERFSRRISEYFRERIKPSAPAFNAAAVAAYVS